MLDAIEKYESTEALLARAAISTATKPLQIIFEGHALVQPEGAEARWCFVRQSLGDNTNIPVSLILMFSRNEKAEISVLRLSLLLPGQQGMYQGIYAWDQDKIFPGRIPPEYLAQAVLSLMSEEDGTIGPHENLVTHASAGFFVTDLDYDIGDAYDHVNIGLLGIRTTLEQKAYKGPRFLEPISLYSAETELLTRDQPEQAHGRLVSASNPALAA
jgi:hypothetical protein